MSGRTQNSWLIAIQVAVLVSLGVFWLSRQSAGVRRPFSRAFEVEAERLERSYARDSADVETVVALASLYRSADLSAASIRAIVGAHPSVMRDPRALWILANVYEDVGRFSDAAAMLEIAWATCVPFVGGSLQTPTNSELDVTARRGAGTCSVRLRLQIQEEYRLLERIQMAQIVNPDDPQIDQIRRGQQRSIQLMVSPDTQD